ncbi:acyltransferase family protein [Cellulomonas dongxiuzhuiae]|uniref:Acyltransferase n=1 Tax=Cellulomonas dongxiuzhuiae TaxID=2819979 RepID=A0ABX8GM50_9CELL|nr:acyltransferase [Cellulomonas dongxiuzhuiae]MBO3096364.1 acyltransferase [Cellulomonas dongxiuzhuiae]QWC16777.1 acyltransferase [Cellulomonas dongxiuzhuiae]
MHPTPLTAAPRLDSLTGLRFIAALLVFGHHVSALGVMTNESLNFLRPGAAGVSFFFILSGFILTWTARDDDTAPLFWRRRFARVYPAYAAAWVGVMTINLISGDGASVRDLFALTLLQSWVPDESAYFATSAVFWTLSVEAFFYALFPLLIRVIRRMPRSSLWICLAGTAIAVATVAALAHPVERGSTGNWASSVLPLTRLVEFIAGMALARIVQHDRLPRIPLGPAVFLGALSIVAAAFAPVAFMSAAVTFVPFLIIVCAAAQRDMCGTASALAHPRLVTLGEWSYAFYLTHLTVIGVVVSVVERLSRDRETWSGLSLVAPIFGAALVSIGVAAVLHLVVERPMERRLRGSRRVNARR